MADTATKELARLVSLLADALAQEHEGRADQRTTTERLRQVYADAHALHGRL